MHTEVINIPAALQFHNSGSFLLRNMQRFGSRVKSKKKQIIDFHLENNFRFVDKALEITTRRNLLITEMQMQ